MGVDVNWPDERLIATLRLMALDNTARANTELVKVLSGGKGLIVEELDELSFFIDLTDTGPVKHEQ